MQDLLDNINTFLNNDSDVMNDIVISLDELATHVYLDDIVAEKITGIKKRLAENQLEIKIEGYVSVDHQYGSDGDLSRDDGCTFGKDYPFNATILQNLYDKSFEVENFNVNTDSFYE